MQNATSAKATVRRTPPFKELLRARTEKSEPLSIIPSVVLSIDPGETTGWSVWTWGDLDTCGQLETTHRGLAYLIIEHKPSVVVCEDYFVYAWKAEEHSWSRVKTLRYIGGIELTCQLKDIDLVFQTAGQAKNFCTDAKLRSWGFWQAGKKHANDAIRHGAYFLLFHKFQ